ncbi:MAG: SDR family NAD(P)-dependent oxidoreductase [Deltaproteobacteria bacterium]|nr:SDR family NAD(P)-dependent oxidoreductase [Deltaproteobacteria bacterium]
MSNSISKATLITGCSTGIGRSTAVRLAAAGLPVYASARRAESIADLAGQGCKTIPLDVCDETSMREAVRTIEAAEGAVGVLINNAGYGSEGPFEEVPMEEIRRQFETNVFGLVRLTQLCLPGMRRQRFGRIVNLSSMGGRLTLPGGAFYHATKYAVEALSDALRFETSGFGIDVVVVEPGPIRTEFANTAIAKIDSLGASAGADSPYGPFREGLKQSIRDAYDGPMGALAGTPEDVAKAIEKAVTARRPRSRYPVTLAARMLMATRRWLPDRAFDTVLASQLVRPGR